MDNPLPHRDLPRRLLAAVEARIRLNEQMAMNPRSRARLQRSKRDSGHIEECCSRIRTAGLGGAGAYTDNQRLGLTGKGPIYGQFVIETAQKPNKYVLVAVQCGATQTGQSGSGALV
jgi:hypothetical protein